MLITVFGPILIVQLILISLVIFILRLILEFKLLESGIRRFEAWGIDEEEQQEEAPAAPSSIKVVSYKALNSTRRQRIMRATLDHFGPQTRVNFLLDKKILGGVIITFGENIIECSTRDRLQQSGFLKAK